MGRGGFEDLRGVPREFREGSEGSARLRGSEEGSARGSASAVGDIT